MLQVISLQRDTFLKSNHNVQIIISIKKSTNMFFFQYLKKGIRILTNYNEGISFSIGFFFNDFFIHHVKVSIDTTSQ